MKFMICQTKHWPAAFQRSVQLGNDMAAADATPAEAAAARVAAAASVTGMPDMRSLQREVVHPRLRYMDAVSDMKNMF